jgi:hypothetical protein
LQVETLLKRTWFDKVGEKGKRVKARHDLIVFEK